MRLGKTFTTVLVWLKTNQPFIYNEYYKTWLVMACTGQKWRVLVVNNVLGTCNGLGHKCQLQL